MEVNHEEPLSENARREVDVWLGPRGTYARAPHWKRGKGPYPDLQQALEQVRPEVPPPFDINYLDPAEVPENLWPITRTRKSNG